MASADVLTINPGSILLLKGVTWDSDEEWSQAVHAIHEAVGHKKFAVLSLDEDGDEVKVLESVEGLMEFLRDQGIKV